MKIECMIIHLDRATARVAQVDAMKAMVPLRSHVMSAVDGRNMSDAETRAYARKQMRPQYPFELRPSEVATFHSHRACWRKLVEDGLDAALILEDDLRLDPAVFPAALELAMSNIQPGGLIRFPIKLREEPRRHIASHGDIHLRTYDRIALGMVAQLVTHDAAKALLAASETFDRPVDDFLQMQWVHTVPVATVWPSGVSEISAELGGSLISRKSGIVEKLRREILRPIYRRRMRSFSRRVRDD